MKKLLPVKTYPSIPLSRRSLVKAVYSSLPIPHYLLYNQFIGMNSIK